MLPVYGFGLTIYIVLLANTSRRKVDNVKVISYSVANRIIYEWKTCTDAIWRLRLEIVNIEKDLCWQMKI